MKLWQKETDLESIIEDFTVGRDREFDLILAPYDIRASKAHASMLAKIGILTQDELLDITDALNSIEKRVESGDYLIEEGVEDIHSQLELDLTRMVGAAGKKIHAGRSRNDQVLVSLNLFYRDKLFIIKNKILKAANLLLDKAELHKEDLMPGYTHSQIAMVSSFGLWFSSFAESLIQDAGYLNSVSVLINENPLGSAAGYGNSFPLDREYTTSLLDYPQLAVNSMYAQLTRGKSELQIGQALSSMGYSVGKFASDICLFVSANYQFISLPDNITTGSSIMPHKKNPDVFELIRAHSNILMSVPGQISMLVSNLMSGYHRDFQTLKEAIFPSLEKAELILDILCYCIPRIAVRENLLEAQKYDHLYTVDAVNKLVLNGTPFREAYKLISAEVEKGEFKPDKTIIHSHTGSIGNLGLDELRSKLARLS